MDDWIDVSQLEISRGIIELVPPEVAQTALCLPIAEENDALVVAVADPKDREQMEKLCFILNRRIRFVGAALASLKFAVWRYYG